MKALPFKIPKGSTDTLIVQEDKEMVFYDKFHQHEEIQISCIILGEGSVIVGDAITDYQAGDILVFGSHVPHVLKSEPSGQESYMISVFFTKASFGADFFELPEFDDFSSFFRNSLYGMKIISEKETLKALFVQLKEEQTKMGRFMIFLNVLSLINAADIEPISSFISKKMYSDNEGNRMASVFQLVMDEFHREITLKEVAEVANMTPNAFCRYFKQRTNKTFFQFLTTIRVENVGRLLAKHKEMTIQEASYHSGFNNLSNFNKKFKEIKGVTPSVFKKQLYDSHLL
ncbi:helix-turn-helix domain-containing protein [Aquimarina sp. TRL1]|uniref:AraC family transcriptional regulator n=1 Tax=Aquimarina sp. (strain TRL1) TaxID=2736252 RepID=UPI00158B8FEB|nr:helix-turn-helix transcriptional regulator [Aquimarina sp. TRL1]QKX04329.1 helix-turn-helix domain-containing protein [Aquimarina sp. TRL1]